MQVYASFAEWKKDQSAKNRRLIGVLERIAEEAAPRLRQGVKWGQGCWLDGDRPVFYIHAEPTHVQLGFYAGSTLEDPRGLLEGNGKYVRFVRIRTEKDIDAEALTALIEQVL